MIVEAQPVLFVVVFVIGFVGTTVLAGIGRDVDAEIGLTVGAEPVAPFTDRIGRVQIGLLETGLDRESSRPFTHCI